MSASTIEEAQYHFRQAYTCQMSGRLSEAIDLYQKSIDVYPTTEAYTFLGWTYSFLGEYDIAIEKCKEAIVLDPDFGNPYNDIGAYLIKLERYSEAVPWLALACSARRYKARHYPHYNLGRIYERLGRYQDALTEYRAAATIEPSYTASTKAAERLLASTN